MQKPLQKSKSSLHFVTFTQISIPELNCRRLSPRSLTMEYFLSISMAVGPPLSTVQDPVLTLDLPTPDDTDRLGARLAAAFSACTDMIARDGFALRLEGNLGAGKTSLVRALLRACGFTGPVKSPTFSLVETYPVLGGTLAHFDFYRFEDPMEFEDAGFRDDFAPGTLAVTEWSEKAMPFLPDADFIIEIDHAGYGRKARLRALTPNGVRLLEALPCDAAI